MAEPRRMKTREHGTNAKYQREHCRCDPCRAAHAKQYRDRLKRHALGDPPRCDAGPARDHCDRLRHLGMTNSQIAAAATDAGNRNGLPAVDRTQVRALLDGQLLPDGSRRYSQRLDRRTAAMLLAVRPAGANHPHGALVDGIGTRRRLQALQANGWPARDLARRLGAGPSTRLQIAKRSHVFTATAEAVKRLYDELENVEGPSFNVRTAARGRGWLPPGYWDAHTLDDPNYAPPTAEYDEKGQLLWDAAVPRQDLVVRLTEQGRSIAEIADLIGVDERRVRKDRTLLRRQGLLERAAS